MLNSNFQINWPFIGNEHILHFLDKSLYKNNLSQLYIFSGPENLGKAAFAKRMIQILLCQKYTLNTKNLLPCDQCLSCQKFNFKKNNQIAHADFHILEKKIDKKNIVIEDVREFIRVLNFSSLNGRFKAGLIKNAENLNESGSNALLKTLEEPKKETIIILTTSDLDCLLPTILSRGQIFNFYPVASQKIYDFLVNEKNINRDLAKKIAFACLGRPALALKLLEDKNFALDFFERSRLFIDFLSGGFKERFVCADKILIKGKKESTAESSDKLTAILNSWEIMTRDLMIFKLGKKELSFNLWLENEIEMIQKRISLQKCLNILECLKQAKKYLSANVSAKNVLDYLAVNL